MHKSRNQQYQFIKYNSEFAISYNSLLILMRHINNKFYFI